jgi:alpha-amylase/alpha-mannosidase (GH57 family)
MTRYVCIHGHFYQPPRENPWLDAIERQDSAAPFHDWNERITAECYRPNAFARVLDRQGRIDRLVNNYARISFNVGPTLMTWLAQSCPDVHEAVVEADRLAIARTGSGAAIAQAHGHLILPLASARDRRTQVGWGARDFEIRFGRRPRGMWLPETACDTPTLEALADEGIEFTVLAPSQAARIRPKAGAPWTDVRGGRVETRRPYRVPLPSGRAVTVFFYDGPTSRAVAFERLLDDGEGFARRLTSLLQPNAREPQLVHIATDGETYGHHHRFGEMALAYALDAIEREGAARVTTYEAYLRAHPATWEAEIVEGTAWSCAHGVERWKSHCGCSSGAHPSWSQAWRTPLRNALDVLRDRTSELVDREGRTLFADPWAARDEYIDVVAETDPRRALAAQERFLSNHVRPELVAREPRREGDEPGWAVRALSIMELTRHAMSMYTSCGWFFDDLSGIETTQVLTYALRVVELARQLFAVDLEPAFLDVLGQARSNLADQGDGRAVYRAHVLPRSATLDRAAAHFAVASLFNEYGDDETRLGFAVHFEQREVRTAGRARLALGVAAVTSRATLERERFEYAVIHLGDHHLGVGVRPADGARANETMRAELALAFGQADLTQMLRALEHHFARGIASRVSDLPGLPPTPPGRASYSLRSLFKDEQKRILDVVLASTLESVERAYVAIYEQHAPLMRYLAGLGQPVPRAFLQAAQYTLLASIRRELARGDELDLVSLEALVQEARETGVVRRGGATQPQGASPLDDGDLAEAAREALRHMVEAAVREDSSVERITLAAGLARFLVGAGITIDHDPAQDHATLLRDRLAAIGMPEGWQVPFGSLLEALRIAPHRPTILERPGIERAGIERN